MRANVRASEFNRDTADLIVYAERMEKINPTQRHSIVHRRHRTRRPLNAEERAYPLHTFKLDSTIDIVKARNRMRPEVRARFEEVYRLIENPRCEPCCDVDVSSGLTAADAMALVRDGVARPVTLMNTRLNPTKGSVAAFLVVEGKIDESTGEITHRKRMIHHPKAQNEALNGVYNADLPIAHISQYLPLVLNDYAATLDLKCGYWQMPLSQKASAWYRFRDAEGTLYEMRRVMMGHVVAVELMQLLAGVVFGDSRVVQEQHVAPAATVDIWIDGVIYTGSREAVNESVTQARQAARDLKATIKNEPTTVDVASQKVTFIGVDWNFSDHTVKLGTKTLRKLPEKMPERLTAQEVEQMIGRLIFAAGLLQIPLAEFYFTMKWAKRVCSKINSGEYRLDTEVEVPPCLRKELPRWLKSAGTTHRPRVIIQNSIKPILFVDATPDDYGAILVMPSGQVHVTGGKFDRSDGLDPIIAVREAQAILYAMQDFQELLRPYDDVDVRCDNTTAEQSLRKGNSKCAEIADVVCRILRRSVAFKINISISRIGTKENPADEPSRGLEVNFEKLRLALATRVAYQRKGAGRVFVVAREPGFPLLLDAQNGGR